LHPVILATFFNNLLKSRAFNFPIPAMTFNATIQPSKHSFPIEAH